MAVFVKETLRGPALSANRLALLSEIAELGVIEIRPTVTTTDSKWLQYLVRVARPDAPWLVMDGKELLPWLLGIANGLQLADQDPGRSATMLSFLKPHMGTDHDLSAVDG